VTTDPVLPTEWARLHKLSPVLRSARAVVALATVVGSRQIAPGQHANAWLDLVIVGVAAIAAVISWLVTRWRIHNGELQIETGFIRRQSLRVPLTRLQAVDIVRPLLARMLGLAEVRIVVAGQGSGRTRLAYLTEERAAEVRGRLLALAHGLESDTPPPAERPILSVPPRRLIAANLLAPGPLLLGGLVVGALSLVVVSPTAAIALTSSAFAIGIALLLATAQKIGAEWDFHVAEAPDGLRLRSGLLQTRAETIPYGRAQAVRWVEPLLWRPSGWVRLEIDVARRRDRDRAEHESGSNSRALLPVGTAADATWLLSRVLPGVSTTPPPGTRVPVRALWRAPLMWHNLHAWYDDNYVVCVTGRLRRSIVVVPLAKIQSLRWSQGPISRTLRLATVHADTAGRRFPGAAPYRDARAAESWMQALPDLARAARQRDVKR
jgi:putative membrane protein